MDISKDFYSIGELANSSGISENSLRIWERRYKKPTPDRLLSGHRRYPKEQFIWLLKVSEALSLGFKTSKVINASEAELERMLLSSHGKKADSEFAKILDILKNYNDKSIVEVLTSEYDKKGTIDFCDDYLSPLLTEIGRLWATNELSIRHEHFMTSIVQKLLHSLSPIPINDKLKNTKVLICSLEGETHSLGLLMTELVTKYLGANVIFLGPNTPEDEIIAFTQKIHTDFLALSVPLSSANLQTEKRIKALRASLPLGVEMIIGSKGERTNRMSTPGIHFVKDFKSFKKILNSKSK